MIQLLFVMALFVAPTTEPSKPANVVNRADVDRLVEPLIEGKYAQSVVVAIVDQAGTRVFGYGTIDGNEARAPDGNTVYEIGSISKVFTSLLLADMEQAGIVNRDDPVQKYLPDDLKLSVRDREMTLLDLATHQSGLPRMPSNFSGANSNDPYAEYDADKLMEFLRSWKPTRAGRAARNTAIWLPVCLDTFSRSRPAHRTNNCCEREFARRCK